MKKYIGLLLIFIIILTACNQTKDKNKEKNISIQGKAKNENQYIFTTDDQPFYGGYKNITATEEGYYIMFGEYLYFYDNMIQEMTLLCNKPNCNHKNQNCNARFWYFENIVCYNNNLLYMIGPDWENENDMYLYEVSKDGSARKKLSFLFMMDEAGEYGHGIQFSVHRGYAYFSMSSSAKTIREDTQTLYRINLTEGNHEKEELYTKKGYGLILHGYYGYGNKMFFWSEEFESEEGSKSLYHDYYYDIEKNEIVDLKLSDNPYDIFAIMYAEGDIIYYVHEGKFRTKNLVTKEEKILNEEVYADGILPNACDNDNFYIFNNRDNSKKHYTVMNKEGKVIDDIDFNQATDDGWPLFGDGRNLFVEGDRDINLGGQLFVYDKKQIGTGSPEWKTINYDLVH